MKHFGKKLLAAVISIAMAVPVGNVFGTTASAATFLQGDANGDGTWSMADLLNINRYIGGLRAADGLTLARMDCDSDYAITAADANILQSFIFGTGASLSTVNRSALTEPLNQNEQYVKYDFDSSISDEDRISRYTLSALPYISAPARSIAYAPNEKDEENLNVVQLYVKSSDSGPDDTDLIRIGSGFIVDDNIIATAAHCVYDNYYGSGFDTDIAVAVYDAEGLIPVQKADVLSIHIPAEYETVYTNNRDSDDYYYDYALLEVDADLSQYGIWSLGVATDEFVEFGKTITASGFTEARGTSQYPLQYKRYKSTGPVYYFSRYRAPVFTAKVSGGNGKSGGPAYYTTNYNNIKSVVGIQAAQEVLNDSGIEVTHCCMLTPSRIQFYLDNPNI